MASADLAAYRAIRTATRRRGDLLSRPLVLARGRLQLPADRHRHAAPDTGNTRRFPQHYRGQSAVLLVAVTLPWAGNLLYLAGWSPSPGLDPTSVVFLLSGLAFAFGRTRYHIFDLVPVARDVLIEAMRDAVIVIDVRRRLVTLNDLQARHTDRPLYATLLGRDRRVSTAWRHRHRIVAERGSGALPARADGRIVSPCSACLPGLSNRVSQVMYSYLRDPLRGSAEYETSSTRGRNRRWASRSVVVRAWTRWCAAAIWRRDGRAGICLASGRAAACVCAALLAADGLALVLMLIASALTLVTPYLIKIAIDEHIARRDFAGLSRDRAADRGRVCGHLHGLGRAALSAGLGRPARAGDAARAAVSPSAGAVARLPRYAISSA